MKKIIIIFLFVFTVLYLISCGGNSETEIATTPTSSVEVTTGTPSSDDSKTDETTTPTTEDTALKANKRQARSKLDEIITPVLAKLPDGDLKMLVQEYYESEKLYIEQILDNEEAKEAVSKVIADTKEFAIAKFKPLLINKVEDNVNPLIEAITYVPLKDATKDFFIKEMIKIDNADNLEALSACFNEIIDDTKTFIVNETEKILVVLKNKALEELEPYVQALIEKIPYNDVKDSLSTFYTAETAKLAAVTAIDEVDDCIVEIKQDLEDYALSEAKKYAVNKLKEIVNQGLEKIPNQELKADLSAFAEIEFKKINDVEKLTDVVPTLEEVTSETKEYIKTLLVSTMKEYVKKLTQIETTTAYDYLPLSMQPNYKANLIKVNDVNYDFTSFVNVNDINKAGFGEQWQMVIENINQSVLMAKVFNVAQTALTAATNALDIYITNSYNDTMNYQTKGSNYKLAFSFENSMLIFNVEVTEIVNLPIIGNVYPKIKMRYNLDENKKEMYISLGDSYKLYYGISDDSYEMATTYGITVAGKTGSRASILTINTSDGKTVGHISEFTSLENEDKIKACADFYIENGYCSVIGNKASGMIGFTGYINELYLVSNGYLLGYEVKEELEVAGVKGTYNTIWFNIWDFDGISSLKVIEKTNDNKSSKSTVNVYLNGNTKLLVPTYNTKLTVKTSRKYDIEYRSRFYYSYDAENDKYIATEVQIPMMFIQEGENLESFTKDFKHENDMTINVSLQQQYLDKIISDYHSYVNSFASNKELYSSNDIVDMLNNI